MPATHPARYSLVALSLMTIACGESATADTMHDVDTNTAPDADTDTNTADPFKHCEVQWPRQLDHPDNANDRGLVGRWWVQKRTWVQGDETVVRHFPFGELPRTVQTEFLVVDAAGEGTGWEAITWCSGQYVAESSVYYEFEWLESKPGTYSIVSDRQVSFACTISADEPHALRCEEVDGDADGTMELWRL